MTRRARMYAILGLLLAGALGIISSTQTWLTVTRADGGEALAVSGADAVSLLAPLSLAVLALGAAMSIAGRVLRYVLAGLGLAGAVVLVLTTVPLLTDPPLSAVAPVVSEATGLGGEAGLHEVVSSITPSAWPGVSLVAWALLLAASVFVLLTAHRWNAGGRRYRSTPRTGHRTDGPLDAIDSWDELSHGADPTDGDR